MKVNATVNYHVIRDEPQAFLFDVDGIDGNLVSPELVPTVVEVNDLRDRTCQVDFEADGICFRQHVSSVTDFNQHNQWHRTYNAQIVSLLKSSIAADEVMVFDHTVRIDDQSAIRKPARNVHNDYSQVGAEQRLLDLLGEEIAADYRAGHYAFVNVWRPVGQPIFTSPLGFIRPSSMSPADWMNIELIYPNRKGQILGVAANPQHEWFYLSHMQPDEVAIFNIFDNQGRPFLAHSALDVIGQSPSNVPRQSIETRTLVRYRDKY